MDHEERKRFLILFLKRAFFVSIICHICFLIYKWQFAPDEPEKKEEAIKITLEIPETPPEKNKVLQTTSTAKESEKLTQVPKEKIVSGTKKVVKDATVLGNKDAPKVQDVQKGDPNSKQMTKYKPGTEFRKLQQTNIGSGASGPKMETANPGGSGNVYKGPDFAVKSLNPTALEGARFKVRNAEDDMGAGAGISGGIGDGQGRGGRGDGSVTGTPNGTLEKAKILNNAGSLTGTAAGAIGVSKGAEGLSAKGTMMLAGIPNETVVLGSMDPSLIRQILIDHLSQFRYCYQSELDDKESDTVSGVVLLNFTINSQGAVSATKIGGDSTIPGSVRSCVGGVLRGIQFPEPRGGGVVQVNQPMNFFPKKI